MGISYEERGGRTYVYRTSTKRVAGKKNPVCHKEYIGILDPKTRMIRPKSIPSDSLPDSFRGGEFRSLDYGNVLISLRAAERMGLKEDLESVFGDDAGTILALAVSQAVNPYPSKDLIGTAETLYLGDILGHDRRLTADSVRKAVGKIDPESTESLFSLLKSRESGRKYLFGFSGTFPRSDLVLPYEYETDGTNPRDVRLFFMSNKDGLPISAGIEMGRRTDPLFLRSLAGDSGGIGAEHTIVVRISDDDAEMMARMVMNGIDVVMGCSPVSEEMASIVNDIVEGLTDESNEREFSGKKYCVKQCRLGLLNLSERWIFVPEYDARFRECTFGVNAFISMDPLMNKKNVLMMDRFLKDRKRAVENGSPESMIIAAITSDHGLERHIDPRSDSDGRSNASREKDPCRSLRERAGIFMFLTTSFDWDDAMKAFRIRRDCVSQAGILIRTLYGDSDRKYRSWEFFTNFLAMVIRSEIGLILIKAGETGITVDDAMRYSSAYRVVSGSGIVIHSERSRNADRILRLFEETDGRDE